MKTYRVYFTFQHAGYFDISAKSSQNAEEQAEEAFTEDENYHFLEGQGFQIYEVEKIR